MFWGVYVGWAGGLYFSGFTRLHHSDVYKAVQCLDFTSFQLLPSGLCLLQFLDFFVPFFCFYMKMPFSVIFYAFHFLPSFCCFPFQYHRNPITPLCCTSKATTNQPLYWSVCTYFLSWLSCLILLTTPFSLITLGPLNLTCSLSVSSPFSTF